MLGPVLVVDPPPGSALRLLAVTSQWAYYPVLRTPRTARAWNAARVKHGPATSAPRRPRAGHVGLPKPRAPRRPRDLGSS